MYFNDIFYFFIFWHFLGNRRNIFFSFANYFFVFGNFDFEFSWIELNCVVARSSTVIPTKGLVYFTRMTLQMVNRISQSIWTWTFQSSYFLINFELCLDTEKMWEIEMRVNFLIVDVLWLETGRNRIFHSTEANTFFRLIGMIFLILTPNPVWFMRTGENLLFYPGPVPSTEPNKTIWLRWADFC